MKRRDFLKVGGAGLAASAVAAPAIAQTNPEIKWRLTASWPKALDTLYGGCEYFVKRVAEITDNKFQIQSFAAGEIVPGLQVLDAVSNGTVEMGNTALYYYWGKDPAFTFGTSLPFGLNTRAHIAWLRFGGGTEMLNDLLKDYKCVAVPTGSTGAQMGGWFRKEIKSVGRFQGPEIPRRRFRRHHHRQGRRRAAADRGRRHLSGAAKRAPSMRPSGSVPTTTRSSAS